MNIKTESDLRINLNDISKIKKENFTVKSEEKLKSLEDNITTYNKEIEKALEAPVPSIALHYNEVLTRAVPPEIKTKAGLILSTGSADIQIGRQIEKMSHSVELEQEILMVGSLVSEEEMKRGIRPGRICKFKLDRFRGLTDHGQPGQIQTEYNIPLEKINGYKYIILDKRDILYTRDKS